MPILEQVLQRYGSPAQVAACAEVAEMRRVGRPFLAEAGRTVGRLTVAILLSLGLDPRR